MRNYQDSSSLFSFVSRRSDGDEELKGEEKVGLEDEEGATKGRREATTVWRFLT